MAKDGGFELPITQSLLGDCLGLSAVHVNRVLQDLRGAGLLAVNRANFRLLQQEKLEQVAGVDGTYLHQTGPLAGIAIGFSCKDIDPKD
ncbi:helix-turn-helix domain-containing protein [Bradyrhizobium neotropicale]|uniref:helix-turn-helix domain-containing protein n=1 Tax=Bradyrhizobium neotropicale TaxID=1497615 RepID=UPI001FEED426|nr:helix-turn-helix domain-containing protein [Bradyrhizobium neotropicale]